MNNFDFLYYFILILFLILTILILPKNIIVSFSRDLNQTNMNDKFKIIVTKSRLFLIGFFVITYYIYFNNISIELVIIIGLIIYLLTPKLVLTIKKIISKFHFNNL